MKLLELNTHMRTCTHAHRERGRERQEENT